MALISRQTAAILIVSALLFVFVSPPHPLTADSPTEGPTSDGAGTSESGERKVPKRIGDFNEITPALRAAVEDGLDFLATGVMSSPDGSAHPSYPVAVTALTGLAFLSAGETPTRGTHSQALRRCLEFIVNRTNPSTGLISEDGRAGLMYSHGFATLFLAQAYGTKRSIRLRRAVRASVRLIEETQGPGGGWSYQPIAQGRNDMSIGVCQTMALRAARNVGVAVSAEVIRKAILCAVRARSVQRVDRNGKLGFAYNSSGRPGGYTGGITFPVTSGSLCILYGLGVYEDNGKNDPEKNPGMLIRPALNYLLSNINTCVRGRTSHFYYAHYYSSQAMAQAGGARYWGRWFPVLRDTLLGMRGGRPYWSGNVSNYYCTAMAILILTVPYQYLPILNQ